MVDLASNALTTLETLKEDLGITGSGEDEKLKRYINAASDAFERYCGRTFYRDTAVVESVAGFGTQHLRLSRRPVNSITSITFDGESVDTTNVTIDDAGAGLVANLGGWQWTAHLAPDVSQSPLPRTERKLFAVTYDGGWYTPKQEADDPADVRTLPWDVEEAVLELSRGIYFTKTRNPTVTGEKLMSWSATYGGFSLGKADSWPSSARTTANLYRRLG